MNPDRSQDLVQKGVVIKDGEVTIPDDFFDHPHKIREVEQDIPPLDDQAAAAMAGHRHQSVQGVEPVDVFEGISWAERTDPHMRRMVREAKVARQQKIIAQIIDLWPMQKVIKTVAAYNRTRDRVMPYVDLYRSRREARRPSL